MKSLISFFKNSTLVLLVVWCCPVNAEYYLECYKAIPQLISANGLTHHCYWRKRHAHHHPYRHRHSHRHHFRYRHMRNLEMNCDQDLATGDDNACLHPDMQIN